MSELSVGTLSGLAANSYVIDVASGSSLDLSNGATLPAGSILQVVSTTKLDTFSMSSGTYAEITGLTVSITPTSTSSKILVILNGWGDTSSTTVGMIQLIRGGSSIANGSADGARAVCTTAFGSFQGGDRPTAITAIDLDSPNTTSTLEYGARLRVPSGTAHINRYSSDLNSSVAPRTVSTITVMEVAG